jgi:hypothetical protein
MVTADSHPDTVLDRQFGQAFAVVSAVVKLTHVPFEI